MPRATQRGQGRPDCFLCSLNTRAGVSKAFYAVAKNYWRGSESNKFCLAVLARVKRTSRRACGRVGEKVASRLEAIQAVPLRKAKTKY